VVRGEVIKLKCSFSAESCLKCLVLVRSLRTAVLVVLVEVMEKLLVCVCVVTTFVPIQSMITSWRKHDGYF
jgi:hypothetical protein